MKSFYRLMVAAFVSIGIAAALSIVPKLDASLQFGRFGAPAFRAETAVALTDRNLVDLLVRQPLHLDIGHVEWNDSILSVDLKASPDDTDAEMIYDDLYELARLGFSGTSNVRQLLVRVMEQPASPPGPPQLLLAMDAKREDAFDDEQKTNGRSKLTKEAYLSSHFSLTYTHKWLDRQHR